MFVCINSRMCLGLFLQLFVQSNHGDEETTRITYFTFIGTPVQATNMNDFKRVSPFFTALLNALKSAQNGLAEHMHLAGSTAPQLKVVLASKRKRVASSYSCLVCLTSVCSAALSK